MSVGRASILLVTFLFLSTGLPAQEQRTNLAGPKPSPVITAATTGPKVRFGSVGSVCQIRVLIIPATGDALFDSGWRDGNVLDWPVDTPEEPVASGSYRCVVMAKDLDGQVTEKDAILVARGGQVSIEPRDGAGGLTVVRSDESGAKITFLAHDGANGAVVNTGGDLSFRFGNFLAGKDSERMRLTAGGALGIGTDKPEAPLDVKGLIRTSDGIMFSDGTILTTAAGLPGEQESGKVKRQRPSTPPIVGIVGELRGQPAGSTASRLKPSPAAVPDYQFKVDATGVHVGTTSAFGLDVAGNVTLSSNLDLPATSSASAGVITLGGVRFAHQFGGITNTFLGYNAGNFSLTGGGNTVNGYNAFLSNTSGFANTAVGYRTLIANSTGGTNTVIGNSAMTLNSTGSGNIAVGWQAGQALTTGDNNIEIGNAGVTAEASTIRIGTELTHTRAFIAGIRNVTTGVANAIAVMIDSNGQLGTVSSSRRYKFDINDMADSTEEIMRLRPVTFRYLGHGDSAPRQYGLIAEEVAEVNPDLVTRNKDGEVDTVMYQFLAPMLLKEVQKQHQMIEEQQRTIDALERRLRALEVLVK